MNRNDTHLPQRCAGQQCEGCAAGGPGRRGFVAGVGAAAAGLAFAPGPLAWGAAPERQAPVRTPLRVQPALIYATPQRRNATSWREWGGVQTEQQAGEEQNRIQSELAAMKHNAEFPLEILPLASAKTMDEAAAIARGRHDVTLVYAAGGGAGMLEALTSPERRNLIFLRHRSGPAYLWYEIAHPRYFRKTVDDPYPGLTTDDIVVDSHEEVLWRLRGLYGLKNALGKRIVALGGAGGWGAGGREAPARAREIWNLDIREVSYDDLRERLKRARADDALVRRCRDDAGRYLAQKGTRLETARDFVDRCFLLTEVFRGLLDEFQTDAFTINQCMGTIMEVSETTACLPLSLLNDEGYMAFCESDFVVIPSGLLLHYVSGKPVFLNDPTYPHDGIITCAHCTAPRKLDGTEVHDARILTHFESDYGAAPKVEFRKGQPVTNIIPAFSGRQWLGAAGKVVASPFMPICRSQVDIAFDGDWRRLAAEMRGFHWITSYGDYTREVGYAAAKLGIGWVKV
jgi:hypothetical protein